MKDKSELEKSATEVKEQFDGLEAERKQLVEQRSGIDRRLSEIESTMVEAKGIYRGLMFAQGLNVDGTPLPPEEPEEKEKKTKKPN